MKSFFVHTVRGGQPAEPPDHGSGRVGRLDGAVRGGSVDNFGLVRGGAVIMGRLDTLGLAAFVRAGAGAGSLSSNPMNLQHAIPALRQKTGLSASRWQTPFLS